MNTTTPDKFRNALAFFLVAAFVLMVPALIVWAIPVANKDIITYMVGQLSGMATTALGYYFVNKVGQDAADAAKTDNTRAAFEAVKAAAVAGGAPAAVVEAASDVADAASKKAADIAGGPVEGTTP